MVTILTYPFFSLNRFYVKMTGKHMAGEKIHESCNKNSSCYSITHATDERQDDEKYSKEKMGQ